MRFKHPTFDNREVSVLVSQFETSSLSLYLDCTFKKWCRLIFLLSNRAKREKEETADLNSVA